MLHAPLPLPAAPAGVRVPQLCLPQVLGCGCATEGSGFLWPPPVCSTWLSLLDMAVVGLQDPCAQSSRAEVFRAPQHQQVSAATALGWLVGNKGRQNWIDGLYRENYKRQKYLLLREQEDRSDGERPEFSTGFIGLLPARIILHCHICTCVARLKGTPLCCVVFFKVGFF